MRTQSHGSGAPRRSSLQGLLMLQCSLVRLGFMVLKNSRRRGRTNFSCDLLSMRDAGPMTRCIDIDYPMVLPTSYACSAMRSSTTFLSVVFSVTKYGNSCFKSLAGKPWCRRRSMTSQHGAPSRLWHLAP
jgi:hypothetical protein